MKAVYTDKEMTNAVREKRKLLAVWLFTLVVFLAIEISLFVIYFVRVEVEQDRSLQTAFTVISIAVGILYSFFSLAFFGVKYRYTKAYVKMFADMKSGNKDKSHGVVLSVNQELTEKDSVKFYSIEVECPPVRREQRNVRTLLIEKDHSIEDINEGDRIEFFAHSGILLGYEILKRTEEYQ